MPAKIPDRARRANELFSNIYLAVSSLVMVAKAYAAYLKAEQYATYLLAHAPLPDSDCG
jgi:hypothetical protein